MLRYTSIIITPSLAELVAKYWWWGDHRYFLLCETSPMLDLKIHPKPSHGRRGGFRGWRDLAFLWTHFNLLVFSKDVDFFFWGGGPWTALLQLDFSAASVSQLTGSISVLSRMF